MRPRPSQRPAEPAGAPASGPPSPAGAEIAGASCRAGQRCLQGITRHNAPAGDSRPAGKSASRAGTARMTASGTLSWYSRLKPRSECRTGTCGGTVCERGAVTPRPPIGSAGSRAASSTAGLGAQRPARRARAWVPLSCRARAKKVRLPPPPPPEDACRVWPSAGGGVTPRSWLYCLASVSACRWMSPTWGPTWGHESSE